MPYIIRHIAELIEGKSLLANPSIIIEHLLTDSRRLIFPSSTLFFALSTSRKNGAEFIEELYKAGVKSFVVNNGFDTAAYTNANFIFVQDTLLALHQVAAYHRGQFTIPVIGITGSNGKTIVKEWLYQLLNEDYTIVRSPKSFNSQIGVPISIWQMNEKHTLAIFEAGISQAGEMDRLANIIQPTVGVLTNIGEAHSSGFSSHQKKLSEKWKLFETTSTIICNSGNELIKQLSGKEHNKEILDWSHDPDIEKLKIDQYVMHGGNVIWFVDKLYAEMDSLLRAQTDFVAFDKNLNLDDILFKYGVRINGDLLQDLKCAKQPLVVGQAGGQPQIQRVPFPYFPLLSSPSTHPVSKNLDDILSIFPSSVDTVKAPGIKKTILLTSDTLSRTLSTPALVSLQSVKSEDDLRTFTKSYVPVAVLLEGKFPSLYANRLSTELRDTLSAYTNKPFVPAATKEAKQIVVSDGDIVTNAVTESEGLLPMGTQQYENYTFANREFLMNAVDYLVNPNGVLETRSKDVTLRLLDKQKILTEKTMWQVINIVVPILLVLLFGWLYQYKRKKTFAV